MVRRFGDRLSMGLLVAVCGGTFMALAITSAAKKANNLGRPQLHAGPADTKNFDERLKALEKQP